MDQRDIMKEDNNMDEMERRAVETKPSIRSRTAKYPKPSGNSVHRTFRRSPANMGSGELDKYLSTFYLIKTPYGYALGRQNPSMSATSIARRSVRSANFLKSSEKGTFEILLESIILRVERNIKK